MATTATEGLLNTARFAKLCGVTAQEVRRRVRMGILQPHERSEDGHALFTPEQVQDFRDAAPARPRTQNVSGESCAEVFRLLREGKTLRDIVESCALHPDTVQGIARSYAACDGGIFLNGEETARLGKFLEATVLDGPIPPTSGAELLEVLSVAMKSVETSDAKVSEARRIASEAKREAALLEKARDDLAAEASDLQARVRRAEGECRALASRDEVATIRQLEDVIQQLREECVTYREEVVKAQEEAAQLRAEMTTRLAADLAAKLGAKVRGSAESGGPIALPLTPEAIRDLFARAQAMSGLGARGIAPEASESAPREASGGSEAPAVEGP